MKTQHNAKTLRENLDFSHHVCASSRPFARFNFLLQLLLLLVPLLLVPLLLLLLCCYGMIINHFLTKYSLCAVATIII